jgi:hypothetical protein
MRQREKHSTLAYLNFAFIWGKSLLAILVVMFAFIAVKNISPIKPNAQIEIILTWDDNSKNDIDLWVNPPDNKPVYYGNRESEGGLVSLDRDDLGINDQTILNGNIIDATARDEIVSIRGPVTGHYSVVANLYTYRQESGLQVGDTLPIPIHVKIQIVQLTPCNGIVYTATNIITLNNQELFLVNFDLNSVGTITNIDNQHPFSVMSLAASTSTFVSDELQ